MQLPLTMFYNPPGMHAVFRPMPSFRSLRFRLYVHSHRKMLQSAPPNFLPELVYQYCGLTKSLKFLGSS